MGLTDKVSGKAKEVEGKLTDDEEREGPGQGRAGQGRGQGRHRSREEGGRQAHR